MIRRNTFVLENVVLVFSLLVCCANRSLAQPNNSDHVYRLDRILDAIKKIIANLDLDEPNGEIGQPVMLVHVSAYKWVPAS